MTVKYKRLVNIVSAWWNHKSRTKFTEEIVGVVFVRKLSVWNGSFKFRVSLKVRYGKIRTVIADSCRMNMSKRDMWSNMNPLSYEICNRWYCYGSVPSSFESLKMSKGIGGVSVYVFRWAVRAARQMWCKKVRWFGKIQYVGYEMQFQRSVDKIDINVTCVVW